MSKSEMARESWEQIASADIQAVPCPGFLVQPLSTSFMCACFCLEAKNHISLLTVSQPCRLTPGPEERSGSPG